jgi:hypothetical protein
MQILMPADPIRALFLCAGVIPQLKPDSIAPHTIVQYISPRGLLICRLSVRISSREHTSHGHQEHN